MRLGRTAVLVGVLAAAALAADESDAWKSIAKRYEELSKNRDDDANRERRLVLLDMFPYRSEKPCRKLLAEAWDDERALDNRVAVVHLLGGSGDTRALDGMIADLKKERTRSPVIALGLALGYTPDADREEVVARVLKQAKKAKDDLRVSLIRGLGELAHPAALDWLKDPGKMTTEERFERNLALGRCGGEAVVDLLVRETQDAVASTRLGAARGLAAAGGEAAFTELRRLLLDPDETVVRCAARELAAAGRKEAAADMAVALDGVRAERTRHELRTALTKLLERDLGYDAAAWKDLAGGGSPEAPESLPRHTPVFGMPVASDRFALLLDTSRSMAWMNRLDRMKSECGTFVKALPAGVGFSLLAASHDLRDHGWVAPDGRDAAVTWIDELQAGGGFDAREALESILATDSLVDTIVILTDSHPWGSARNESARETMEIFRRMNRTRDVRLLIALVMPGGRYEPSERSVGEIEERIDYLREMADDSGGLFVEVEE